MMQHTDRLIVLSAAFALSIMPVMAQQQPSDAPRQPATLQQQQPATAARASGELVRVDTSAKTLSVKIAGGTEMLFTYSEATKVTGGDQGVAGLATKSGAKVTVHFTMKGQDRIATQIDIENAGA